MQRGEGLKKLHRRLIAKEECEYEEATLKLASMDTATAITKKEVRAMTLVIN